MNVSIIERVARAIRDYPIPYAIDTMSPDDAKKFACAIIAAMREPTESMVWAGNTPPEVTWPLTSRGVWYAMIDTALGLTTFPKNDNANP